MTAPEVLQTESRGGPCGRARSASKPAAGADKNIYVPRSVRINVINWWHVARMYVPHVAALVLAVAAARVGLHVQAGALRPPVVFDAWASLQAHLWSYAFTYIALAIGLVALLWRDRPVYLVDFATFKPPASWRVTHEDIVEIHRRIGRFSPESISFIERILARSETGQETHWPPSIIALLDREGSPAVAADDWKPDMAGARAEAETVIFGCLRDLMARTGIKAREIDFLVINCSLFSPTPSLCAMVSNEFGLRPDCRTFNLGGMGCSAGVISIDLAKQLISNRPNSRAVVISTENLTQQLYLGKQRSFLLQNTLFRCGGAAVLLSSRLRDGFGAKYKLLNTVRYQDASDEAYECVFEAQDDEGERGIRLSKEITKIAGKALTKNLTILGPHVLTLREQAKTLLSLVAKRLVRMAKKHAGGVSLVQRLPDVKSYVPDFKTGIQHFCIHAGGRAVIDGIEKNLKLSEHHVEASKATLRNFGNTSSSSIWYELAHIEDHQTLNRGDRVLQIAFGSGFKCNSAVWLRLR